MKRNKVIGFFDSGLGGLSILKEVAKKLPQYNYVYLGDTARSPYGYRSRDEVYEYTKQAIDFLFKKGAGLIIIACNTASAEALRRIQKEYLPQHYPGRRVLGVIVPTLEVVVAMPGVKRIGVIATYGTVQSGTFTRELKKLHARVKIFEKTAPLLVSLVEEGETSSIGAMHILAGYIKPLLSKHIDTLILGCTHYGHMEKSIRKIVGGRVRLISEGPIVARKLAEYLIRHKDIESTLKKTHSVVFYTTDSSNRFKKLSALFYGKTITTKAARLS